MSYLRQLARIATSKRLSAATGLKVVDVEVTSPFDGGPQEPAVFLILNTERERIDASRSGPAVAEGVRRLLADGGYPTEHALTAYVEVVSREQIKAAGGKEGFFR
jgi:hypothetical protein